MRLRPSASLEHLRARGVTSLTLAVSSPAGNRRQPQRMFRRRAARQAPDQRRKPLRVDDFWILVHLFDTPPLVLDSD